MADEQYVGPKAGQPVPPPATPPPPLPEGPNPSQDGCAPWIFGVQTGCGRIGGCVPTLILLLWPVLTTLLGVKTEAFPGARRTVYNDRHP